MSSVDVVWNDGFGQEDVLIVVSHLIARAAGWGHCVWRNTGDHGGLMRIGRPQHPACVSWGWRPPHTYNQYGERWSWRWSGQTEVCPLQFSPSSPYSLTSSMLKTFFFFRFFLCCMPIYRVKRKTVRGHYYIPKYHNKVGFSSICTLVIPHYRAAHLPYYVFTHYTLILSITGNRRPWRSH